MENFWSLLKRTISGTYVSVDAPHLRRYVDEQAFRFNERGLNDGQRFIVVMPGTIGKRITYKELIGERQRGEPPRKRRSRKRRSAKLRPDVYNGGMDNTPKPKPVAPAPNFDAMPEFAKAIRWLAHVPKKEVDDAIAKERTEKRRHKKQAVRAASRVFPQSNRVPPHNSEIDFEGEHRGTLNEGVGLV